MTSSKWRVARIFSRDYNFFRPAYWFGEVDARPLALFRICLAALLLKVAIYLWLVADEFYSDTGVLPREVLWKVAPHPRFSLMDAMPEAWMARLFFGLWIVVLIALLLGYRTRLMSILNFIIILSVHDRNFLPLIGSDGVMRVLSFWAMFIPLGKAYAIDSVCHRWQTFRITRNTADLHEPPPMIYALPVRLIQIQVALIYLFTFIQKLPGKPWRDGTALFYALQIERIMLPSGTWVLENIPLWMLKMGSYFTLFMEGSFIVLVFLPIFQPILRAMVLLMGVMLHIGIAVLMAIHDFSLVMMISYLTFWDARWVDFFDRHLRLRPSALWLPIPAGNNPVWLLLTLTGGKNIHLTDEPVNQVAGDNDWIVKDANEQIYRGRAAWNKIAEHLPLSRLWGWSIIRALLRVVLSLVGTWVLWRELAQPHISSTPSPIPSFPRLAWTGRILLTVPLVSLMGIIIWMNLANIKNDGDPIVPALSSTPQQIISYLRLKQSWEMFTPYPPDRTGWITSPGQFENGLQIDLQTGKPLSDTIAYPKWGPQVYWNEYAEAIDKSGAVLRAWGDYFCYLYNVERGLEKGERLMSLEVVFNWRWSYLPGKQPNQVYQTRLRQHACF